MRIDDLIASAFSGASLHHAYLVLGSADKNCIRLASVFEHLLGQPHYGHPDYLYFAVEKWGIDSSRSLREEQSRAPVLSSRRIFVIAALGITPDAQQALLKSFEDPSPHAVFFILLPSLSGILGTLRSRMSVVVGESPENSHDSDAARFLSLYPAMRLKEYAFVTEGLAEQEHKSEARERVDLFVSAIERALQAKYGDIPEAEYRTALEETALVRRYMRDPSAAHRLLFEHCALVLPVCR